MLFTRLVATSAISSAKFSGVSFIVAIVSLWDANNPNNFEGIDRLKLYLMLGLPGEADTDIDEGVEFITKLSRIVPVALGIAPFCAKRNTPLDGQPFAGVQLVEARLARLRGGPRGRAAVRAISPQGAWA